jgi:NADH-quinone oxidoreductase subunit M
MTGSTEVLFLLLSPWVIGFSLLLMPSRFQQFFAGLGAVLYTVAAGKNIAASLGGHQSTYLSVPAWASLGWEPAFVLDGVSAAFILMSGLVGIIAISVGGSWIKSSPKLFTFCSFATLGLVNGAFLARDTLVFYLFFEAVLIPAFLMLGVWGKAGKGTAALRFMLMSFAGSFAMLASMIGLGWATFHMTGEFNLSISSVSVAVRNLDPQTQMLLLLGFLLAFAVKLPLFPFHSWLPDAYTLAPTGGTIWMSSVLSKLGAYGFVRILLPIFPDAVAQLQLPLLFLASISVVYAALMAMKEQDLKRMLAYSSVSHLGFVALGAFAGGVEGATAALFLALAHSFSSAGLFAALSFSGWDGVFTAGRGLRVITFLLILAGVALPLSANFVGEFLVLKAAFAASPFAAGIASVGVILGAVYMFSFYRNRYYSPPVADGGVSSLSPIQGLALLPCVVLLFYFGVQPSGLLNLLGGVLDAAVVSAR